VQFSSPSSARKTCRKPVRRSHWQWQFWIDFGFTPEETKVLAVKSRLFRQLQDAIRTELETNTQLEIAKRLEVDQPTVSKILNDRMSGFSMDRIATFFGATGL
jgi:predicted XRE-type DNA-binding protein